MADLPEADSRLSPADWRSSVVVVCSMIRRQARVFSFSALKAPSLLEGCGTGHRHTADDAFTWGWSKPFQGMAPILFAIEHVVEEVDRSGEGTKDQERGHRASDGVFIGEALGEHDRREDEKILRPLTWA